MTRTTTEPETPPTARADDCCGAPARDQRIAGHFDRKTRERTAGGVLPPMVDVSIRLLEQLADDAAAQRPTLLELGCGTGAMIVALLEGGATSADGVDLSAESLATARRRADEAGVGERARFENGDAAVLDLAPHDWVVLDRVFCCYPDVEALLANASGAAVRRLAFSVPTSRGLRGLANRIFWGAEALLTRFRQGPCPGYVHSVDGIEARLAAAGFRRISHASTWFWYTAVWERS